MTRTCCSACRLRFSRASSALVSCPFCAGPLQTLPATALVGYQLVASDDLMLDDLAVELAMARSAALVPPPRP
jgi:hypothetical protein